MFFLLKYAIIIIIIIAYAMEVTMTIFFIGVALFILVYFFPSCVPLLVGATLPFFIRVIISAIIVVGMLDLLDGINIHDKNKLKVLCYIGLEVVGAIVLFHLLAFL